jgi:hypothetical protein
VQAPDRDKRPPGRRGREGWVLLVALAQVGKEARDRRRLDLADVRDPPLLQVCRVPAEVATVGGEGVPRDPALDVEVDEPGLDGRFEAGRWAGAAPCGPLVGQLST